MSSIIDKIETEAVFAMKAMDEFTADTIRVLDDMKTETIKSVESLTNETLKSVDDMKLEAQNSLDKFSDEVDRLASDVLSDLRDDIPAVQ